MSLIQNLEIDTLRLRNLIVRNPDNTPIPSTFHLYSRGDGKTYWSTGVDAQQFINLSSVVSTNQNRISTLVVAATSSINGGLSSVYNSLTSTLYGFSTFATNLSTYDVTMSVITAEINSLSTMVYSTFSTYTTLDSTNELSTQLNLSILSTSATAQTQYILLSSYNQSTINRISSNVDTVYTAFTNYSTTTGSTFSSVFLHQSDLWISTTAYVSTYNAALIFGLTTLEATVIANKIITDSYSSTISGSASTLSTAIRQGDLSTLSASIGFTSSVNVSTISSLNGGLSSLRSTLEFELNSSVKSLQSSISTVSGASLSTIESISTSVIAGLSSLSSNINIFISTGLIGNIYATFIELQSSSTKDVNDAISSNSAFLNSTVSSYTYIYNSSLNYINTSTYNFLVGAAYTSSISTVVPYTISTTNAVVASSVSTFNSTISVEASSFSTVIGVQISTTYYSVNRLLVSSISTISSYLYLISSNSASTIINLSTFLSTAISTMSSLTVTNIAMISTSYYSQFLISSVVLSRTTAISTLNNVSTVTALPFLSAAVANLDLSVYNNYYIELSDLRSDVFYGMTYSTNAAALTNRDITVQIDIKSTYSNDFFTFDTSHFSDWLSRPQIYNPKSFTFLTNEPTFIVPTADTTQQIYISTFVGAYILNMRLTTEALYVKSITAYPYIYSQVAISTITFPSNVQSTDSATSTNNYLMFSGSVMPITWTTNDLNIPLGFKFVGTDLNASTIVNWSGPYSSGLRSANVKVPQSGSPFVQYNRVHLGIYPNTALKNNTTDGNLTTPGQVFTTSTFGKPLGVVTPMLNARFTVYNPSTVATYLQVAELWVFNAKNENVVTDKANTYASLLPGYDVSHPPYGGLVATYGPAKAFDGDRTTYFYGGQDAFNIDQNARMYGTFSTYSNTYDTSVFVSSVTIYGTGTYSLTGMKMKYETTNLPTVILNSFYSTINITSPQQQTFAFS